MVNYCFNEAMDIQEIRRTQLKEIIKQHFNGVASSFAQKIDKEPSYISRIFTEKEEHRRNIGESFAREIEQKLGLPYLFLDTLKTSIQEPRPDYLNNIDFDFIVIKPYQVNQKSSNKSNSYICSGAAFVCPTDIIKRTGSQAHNLRILFMNNDSMTPTINKDTLLLVDITDFEMQSGLIYLINWYGEERIKRAFKDGKNSFKLKSDNQHNALYADDCVDLTDNDDVKVLGRIVWQASNL